VGDPAVLGPGEAATVDPNTHGVSLVRRARARQPQRVALEAFAQPSSDRAALRQADRAGLLTMPEPDWRRRPE
jgi:hypothetical protein